MSVKVMCRSAGWALCCAVMTSLATGSAEAVVPRKPISPLEQKAFVRPELFIPASNAPLREVMDRLPNRAAWQAFSASRVADGSSFGAFVDPRSGTATNIIRAVPLIPGSGVGNRVTAQSLGQRLGRQVKDVDADVVAEATLDLVRAQPRPARHRPGAAGCGDAPRASRPTCGRSASRSSTRACRCARAVWPPASATATW